MSIEALSDEDIGNFTFWTLETGLWDGNPITWKEAPHFFTSLEERLHRLLFSYDSNTFAFEKLAATFAWIGSCKEGKAELADRIEQLRLASNGAVIAAKHKNKSFWKKHKVAIITGIVIIAIVTTVIVITACTGGTGGGAAAIAGGAAFNEWQNSLESSSSKKTPVSSPISEPMVSIPQPEPFELEQPLSMPAENYEHQLPTFPTYIFNENLTYTPPVVPQNEELEVPNTNLPWVNEGMSYFQWQQKQLEEESFQSALTGIFPNLTPSPVPALSESPPVVDASALPEPKEDPRPRYLYNEHIVENFLNEKIHREVALLRNSLQAA